MHLTISAIFDGHVLRPESSADLVPNTRYILRVEASGAVRGEGDSWDLLEELSGTLEAPADWSSEHDHYLYGAPKRDSPTQ